MTSYYQQVYDLVRSIPEGKVVTYGQIAKLIDRPRYARQVGYALAALPAGHDVPWHRVVNARGEISRRAVSDYEDYQQILLEDEGVEFELNGRIDLKSYQWVPDANH
ncbi:MGMT family protein [Arenicella xantha]|uniref:O(6)-alkylguanine repair protein YbaZ n=1 Tax=Arenicella xantha TaxID=644221 RepID=A0A395JKI5_9GAMM|nr:MGMT family protein [Arenicella xantha]RBP51306.1 O(6)-alkylguanine repair protein YbaZ [Arenicella xantha]